jgi:UDP-glucose 4-epimerase
MQVLITGGAGFIGSNITMRCVDLGWNTEIVDRDISRIDAWRKGPYEQAVVHNCDFASDNILDAVRSNKYDVILHQAAVPRVSYSVEHPAETTEENVLKTVKLLEAAAGHCRRFVFASSSSVYGDSDQLPLNERLPTNPKSPYALQKLTGELFIKQFCELKGLDAISLRYFNVFGPWQYGDSPYSTALSAWCYRIKLGLPLRSDGSGEQSRDLCFVENVVSANICAAVASGSFKGEVMNIACGDRTSNNQILEELRKRYPEIQVENAPFRTGDVMHTQADVSKALQLINYKPLVRFWDGFEQTLKWWNL